MHLYRSFSQTIARSVWITCVQQWAQSEELFRLFGFDRRRLNVSTSNGVEYMACQMMLQSHGWTFFTLAAGIIVAAGFFSTFCWTWRLPARTSSSVTV
jgi:hypothetical protein